MNAALQFVRVKKTILQITAMVSGSQSFSDHLVALKDNRRRWRGGCKGFWEAEGTADLIFTASDGQKWLLLSPAVLAPQICCCVPSTQLVIPQHVSFSFSFLLHPFLSFFSPTFPLPPFPLHPLPRLSALGSVVYIQNRSSCSGPLGSSSQTFPLILSIWRRIKVRADGSPARILAPCTNKDAELFQVWASARSRIRLN